MSIKDVQIDSFYRTTELSDSPKGRIVRTLRKNADGTVLVVTPEFIEGCRNEFVTRVFVADPSFFLPKKSLAELGW